MGSEDAGDESLVARARRGDGDEDEDACAALYRRHRDWVVGVAWRMTGSRDDALDVLQETFAYFFGRIADPAFTLTTTMVCGCGWRSGGEEARGPHGRFGGEAVPSKYARYFGQLYIAMRRPWISPSSLSVRT